MELLIAEKCPLKAGVGQCYELPVPPVGATLLTAKLYCHGDRCKKLTVNLALRDGRTLYYNLNMMPAIHANLLFRMKYLDGDVHFPPMESGTLKSGIGGRDAKPEDIVSLSLSCNGDCDIENLRFTDTEPEPILPDRVLCDELGQSVERQWADKTGSIEELRINLNRELDEHRNDTYPAAFDKWGGFRGLPLFTEEEKQSLPHDRFRVVKKDGRWWFADPDGNAFLSIGSFGVYPGEPGWIHGNEGWIGHLPPYDGEFAEAWCLAEEQELYRRKFHGMFAPDTRLYSFATANLIRAYGKEWRSKWTALTNCRFRRIGLNTLSMFSDPQYIKDSGFPYVVMLKRYPDTEQRIFREFPDVFSPEFEEAAKVYAAQLAEYAEDTAFIGYFMNNEPTFIWSDGFVLAEKTLEKTDCASKNAMIAFLRERYRTVDALNAAWNRDFAGFDALQPPIIAAHTFSETAKQDLCDFSKVLLYRWAEIPAKLCRAAAPKRLNLGMRFAGINDLVLVTTDLFDVYSFNCYGLDPTGPMNRISEKVDMPMLLSEFHFGAYDAGLPAASLVPFETQAERSQAYKNYVEAAAKHPCYVGSHWFAWNDQPFFGRYDCENFQFGFVDICNRLYSEFFRVTSETNLNLYDFRLSHDSVVR